MSLPLMVMKVSGYLRYTSQAVTGFKAQVFNKSRSQGYLIGVNGASQLEKNTGEFMKGEAAVQPASQSTGLISAKVQSVGETLFQPTETTIGCQGTSSRKVRLNPQSRVHRCYQLRSWSRRQYSSAHPEYTGVIRKLVYPTFGSYLPLVPVSVPMVLRSWPRGEAVLNRVHGVQSGASGAPKLSRGETGSNQLIQVHWTVGAV